MIELSVGVHIALIVTITVTLLAIAGLIGVLTRANKKLDHITHSTNSTLTRALNRIEELGKQIEELKSK